MTRQEHRAWRASKGPCSIDGCDGLYMARGFCQSHYKRLLKYGDPIGQPTPRPKKVKEVKPPRVRKYPKLCADHKTYQAGCLACQAEARIANRANMADPEKRAAKYAREANRDRSGEHLRRSKESKRRGQEKVKERAATIPQPNRWSRFTDEQIALVMSDMSATAVAALIGRSPQSVNSIRSKVRANPGWLPGGRRSLRGRDAEVALLASTLKAGWL